MINWNTIDTVLLDLDGTLLDLSFDNHFWLTYVPYCFGCQNDLDIESARDCLFPIYRSVEGTLEWYCVDYWSRTLNLDIVALKDRVSHKIRVRPNAVGFLVQLRERGLNIRLVTNAHQKTLALKMRESALARYFDMMISAHTLGTPKEHPEFWLRLSARHPFDPQRALFIDDSVPVLRAARDFGIGCVLTVYQPDSAQPGTECEEFPTLRCFSDIMPVARPHASTTSAPNTRDDAAHPYR